jgi:hypothetical protein
VRDRMLALYMWCRSGPAQHGGATQGARVIASHRLFVHLQISAAGRAIRSTGLLANQSPDEFC